MKYAIHKTTYQDGRPDAHTDNVELTVWLEITKDNGSEESTPVPIVTNGKDHYFGLNSGEKFAFTFSLSLSGQNQNLAHCAVGIVLRHAKRNTKNFSEDEPITLTNSSEFYLLEYDKPLEIKGFGSGEQIRRFMATLADEGASLAEKLNMDPKAEHPFEISVCPITDVALSAANNGAQNVYANNPPAVVYSRRALMPRFFHGMGTPESGSGERPQEMGGGVTAKEMDCSDDEGNVPSVAVAVGPAETVALPAPSVAWKPDNFGERDRLSLQMILHAECVRRVRIEKNDLLNTSSTALCQRFVQAPVDAAPNPFDAFAVADPAPAPASVTATSSSKNEFYVQLEQERQDIVLDKEKLEVKLKNIREDYQQLVDEDEKYTYAADEKMMRIGAIFARRNAAGSYSPIKRNVLPKSVVARKGLEYTFPVGSPAGRNSTLFGALEGNLAFQGLQRQFETVDSLLRTPCTGFNNEDLFQQLKEAFSTLEAAAETLSDVRLRHQELSERYTTLTSLLKIYNDFTEVAFYDGGEQHRSFKSASQSVDAGLKAIEKQMRQVIAPMQDLSDADATQRRYQDYERLVQEAQNAWDQYKADAAVFPEKKAAYDAAAQARAAAAQARAAECSSYPYLLKKAIEAEKTAEMAKKRGKAYYYLEDKAKRARQAAEAAEPSASAAASSSPSFRR